MTRPAERTGERARLIGGTLVRVDRVGSTNDLLRTLLLRGAGEGTAVVAREQTAGRGRMGRPWASPPGGLWLSVLLRPDDPSDSRLALLVAVGVAEALHRIGAAAVGVKWPNDLVAGGRKCGGVLVESLPPWVVAGIGVNVHVDPTRFPPPLRAQAASLTEQIGDADLEEVLVAVLAGLEDVYAAYRAGQVAMLLDRWRALSVTLGQPVRIRSGGPGAGGHEVAGVARDIDAAGALVIDRADGGPVRVLAGDVSVLPGGSP